MVPEISRRAIYLQLSTVTWEIFTNFTKMRDYANGAHAAARSATGTRTKIIRLRTPSPDGTRTGKCLRITKIFRTPGEQYET
ncbi:hypothetical protein PUN28_017364 [Cardiocondyla obscurior]|uniref:Uncharacterized protein n=1 Tax=Cardiocondyla obscurior TaxID=286306 RepID=A0AAW2EMR1_9HYME